MKVLIGTKNTAKADEIRRYLGVELEIISLADLRDPPDVEEVGRNFNENALVKAAAYFRWSGLPVVADDGGLEIDFLGGEPGVKSHRWPGYEASDQELIDMVLAKLKGVPQKNRRAHLRAVGVFFDGTNVFTEEDKISGYIVERQIKECLPDFPFRAIFWVPKFRKLYQDLTPEEHKLVNHKKRLYGRLAERIVSLTSS